LLTAAVERNPGDGEMRLELAELLLEDRNGATAEAHLRKLIAQTPDDPRPYVGLAEARFQQQDLDDAESLLERALERDPRHTRGLLLRGKIAQARRDDRRALDDYYQVLAFDPDHIEAKMLIAELHFQQGDARHAAPLLRSIIETAEQGNPQRAKAQWILGQCYARDGRWSDAARSLGEGIDGRRATARDWQELAEVSSRAGDFRSAETAVAQGLKLAPSDLRLLALRDALDEQARSAAYRGGPVVSTSSNDEPAPPPSEGAP
jgi:cytochrome c-type biogenesis protein CcmH/NrfG